MHTHTRYFIFSQELSNEVVLSDFWFRWDNIMSGWQALTRYARSDWLIQRTIHRLITGQFTNWCTPILIGLAWGWFSLYLVMIGWERELAWPQNVEPVNCQTYAIFSELAKFIVVEFIFRIVLLIFDMFSLDCVADENVTMNTNHKTAYYQSSVLRR